VRVKSGYEYAKTARSVGVSPPVQSDESGRRFSLAQSYAWHTEKWVIREGEVDIEVPRGVPGREVKRRFSAKTSKRHISGPLAIGNVQCVSGKKSKFAGKACQGTPCGVQKERRLKLGSEFNYTAREPNHPSNGIKRREGILRPQFGNSNVRLSVSQEGGGDARIFPPKILETSFNKMRRSRWPLNVDQPYCTPKREGKMRKRRQCEGAINPAEGRTLSTVKETEPART